MSTNNSSISYKKATPLGRTSTSIKQEGIDSDISVSKQIKDIFSQPKHSPTPNKDLALELEGLDQRLVENLAKLETSKAKIDQNLKDKNKISPEHEKALQNTSDVLETAIPAMKAVIKALTEIHSVVLKPVSRILSESNRQGVLFGFVGIFALCITLYQMLTTPSLQEVVQEVVGATNKEVQLIKTQTIESLPLTPAVIVGAISGVSTDMADQLSTLRYNLLKKLRSNGDKLTIYSQLKKELSDIVKSNDYSNAAANLNNTAIIEDTINSGILSLYLELYKFKNSTEQINDAFLISQVNKLQSLNSTVNLQNELKWIEATILEQGKSYDEASTKYKALAKSKVHTEVIDLDSLKQVSINKAAASSKIRMLKQTKRIFILNSGQYVRTKKVSGPAAKRLIQRGYNPDNVDFDNFSDASSNIHAYYRTNDDLFLLRQIVKDLGLRNVDYTSFPNIRNIKIKNDYFLTRKQDIVIRLPEWP